jgi:hypothetical protein
LSGGSSAPHAAQLGSSGRTAVSWSSIGSGAATGVPQEVQNLSPSATIAPQR